MLLDVYELLEAEFLTSGVGGGLERWIELVETSGLPSTRAYKQYPPEDISPSITDLDPARRNLLHPTIVKIREQAIVINASLKPDRYRYLLRVDAEVRAEFSKPLEAAAEGLSRERSLANRGRAGALRASAVADHRGKGHRKSYSTGGMMERASRVLHLRKQSDGRMRNSSSSLSSSESAGQLDSGSSASTSLANQQQVSVPDATSRARERTVSAPPMPFEAWQPRGNGTFSNLYLEMQRICRAIASRPPLPDLALAERAFALSEIVVRHYLTHELPAKYQSAY